MPTIEEIRARRAKRKRGAQKEAVLQREPDHYRLSPSSMKRIRNCPGSLTVGPKESRTTSYSKRGTDRHTALEKCLRQNQWPKDTDLQMVVAYVNTIRSEFEVIAEGFETKIKHPRIANFGGTVDYWLFGKDEEGYVLFVVDGKFGFIEVEAEGNDQLLAYLKLIIDSPQTPDIPLSTNLFGTIVQPARGTKPKEAEFYLADLNRLETDLEMIPKRQHEFKAGEWCRFCDARIYTEGGETKTCPLFSEYILQMGGLEIPSNYDELLSAKEFLKGYYEKLEYELKNRIFQGEEVKGFGLTKALGNREWKDEDKTRRFLAKAGVPADVYEIETVTLNSPAQIEDYVKKSMGGDIDLTDLTTRQQRGYKVVSEDKATHKVHKPNYDNVVSSRRKKKK